MLQLLTAISSTLLVLTLSACVKTNNSNPLPITGGTGELTGGGGGPDAEALRKQVLFSLQTISQTRGQYPIPVADWCPAADALAVIENITYTANAIEVANQVVIKFVNGTLTYEGAAVNAILRLVDPKREKYPSGIKYVSEISIDDPTLLLARAIHEMYHHINNPALQDAWSPTMRSRLNRVGDCVATFYKLYTSPGRKMWEQSVTANFYTRSAITDGDNFLAVNNEKVAAPRNWDARVDRYNRSGQSEKVLSIPAMHAIAIEKTADGKYMVGGVNYDGAAGYRVSRYTNKFELDATFNATGSFTSNFGTYSQLIAMKPLSDGSVVSGGLSYNPGPKAYQFIVAKNNANGTLASGFGTSGVVKLAVGPYDHSVVRKVVPLASGKILAVGFSSLDSSTSGSAPYGQAQSFVVQLNANGTLDTTFGTNGVALINSPLIFIARDALVQSDGKIVVTGDSYGMSTFIATTRLNANGSVDSSFGVNGFLSVTFASDNQASHQILNFPDQMWVLGSFKRANGRWAAVIAIDSNGQLLDRNLTPDAESKGVVTYPVPSTVDDSSIRGAVAANGGVFLNLGNWFVELLGVRSLM